MDELIEGINYRGVDEKDIESIVFLWEKTRDIHAELDSYWKTIPKASEKYLEYISDEIKKENSKVFVAEENNNSNKIIGFLHCKIEKDVPIYERFLCKLDSMFVEENYRGKGIVEKMFEKMEEFAKDKNVEYIVEHNGLENERAKKFYDKVGLEPLTEMRVKKVEK